MKIAVLRGGPSAHYDTSLRTGEFVLTHLRTQPERYEVSDIFIDREGNWHLAGRKVTPYIAVRGTDLVWNALHGDYGEDGQVSQLLTNLRIPHTGSTTLGLAMSMNKDLAKKAYLSHDLPTPRHEVLEGRVSLDHLLDIFRNYLHPVMVKPAKGREGKGIMRAHSFDELKAAVADAFSHADRVLVEEFVRGTDVSCTVIEGVRGQSLYSLVPHPAKFRPEEHKIIEHYARKAHEVLGLRHYSSSDFVVTPKGRIYLLETNALPEVSKHSVLSRSLPSVGLSTQEFIEHVISIAK